MMNGQTKYIKVICPPTSSKLGAYKHKLNTRSDSQVQHQQKNKHRVITKELINDTISICSWSNKDGSPMPGSEIDSVWFLANSICQIWFLAFWNHVCFNSALITACSPLQSMSIIWQPSLYCDVNNWRPNTHSQHQTTSVNLSSSLFHQIFREAEKLSILSL